MSAAPSESRELSPTPHQFWDGQKYRFCPKCQQLAFEFAKAYGLEIRQAAERDTLESRHEPLLEIDGRKINGLKRCAKCGISETYWGRFPTCDGQAVSDEESQVQQEPCNCDRPSFHRKSCPAYPKFGYWEGTPVPRSKPEGGDDTRELREALKELMDSAWQRSSVC